MWQQEVVLFYEMRRYRLCEREGAGVYLHLLRKLCPESVLYRIYAGRVIFFTDNPPVEGRDGVFAFRDK